MGKIIVHRVADLLQKGYPRAKLVEEFVRINQETWPPPVPERYLWTPEKVESHFRICPHMLFCAFEGERIVGTLSAINISFREGLNAESWESTSDYGTFSTHDPQGDTAFGLDLSVPKGAIAGDQLVETGILSGVILANKRGVFLGARVPRYHKHCHQYSIRQYVGLTGQKTRDPEIRIYQEAGFKVLRVIPGYMEDPDSMNYGVLMFWENPFYRYTRYFNPIMKVISGLVHMWWRISK